MVLGFLPTEVKLHVKQKNHFRMENNHSTQNLMMIPNMLFRVAGSSPI